MSLLTDLSAYLIADGSVAVTANGTNIFGGRAPATPSTSIIILRLSPAGSPGVQKLGTKGIAFEWPHVQVEVRGPEEDYAATAALAQAAYVSLGKIEAEALTSGTFYHVVTCLQPPYNLSADGEQRPSLVFNIRCEKEL